MKYDFSFIIPVYNRREEVKELLDSFLNVTEIGSSEILIVEDGSNVICEDICKGYGEKLNISYYFKPNSGPGDSRNYGMSLAKSGFFIVLDSDVLLPSDYVINLKTYLNNYPIDCYGGPDNAHKSFSNVQKSINFTMTSFFTTGGIRGNDNLENYEPRSFNMGISKRAFEASGGFGDIHPGEDPDLSIRLKKLGFKIAFFKDCYVYHKRRVDFSKFSTQVYKFGLVRPILTSWHPESSRLIYLFPTCFSLGLLFSIVLSISGIYTLLSFYLMYFTLILLESTYSNKSIIIGLYSIFSTIIQFFGYGYGFLKSSFNIFILSKNPRETYPFLFYNKHR